MCRQDTYWVGAFAPGPVTAVTATLKETPDAACAVVTVPTFNAGSIQNLAPPPREMRRNLVSCEETVGVRPTPVLDGFDLSATLLGS